METAVDKKPRPVETQTLRLRQPPGTSLVSASVASWKTEQIGFEVAGRIEWVVEPNTEIEGQVEDSDGDFIIAGDPVARIDDEQYRLRVKSAEAKVAQAEQRIAVATIELEKTIPAQIRSAEADKKLALTEYERSKLLAGENAAVAQAEVDRDKAQYETALAALEQLDAGKLAKEAEVQSLQSQLLEAQQTLRGAERDLENCTLYSSFRGRIADVAVVPGSVVASGQAVATIQMMDPIKVEVEVSAADSRRLRNRERIPIVVTRSDGSLERRDGFLYLIDSVADSATRTYTLTLLMMNEKETETDIPANAATTDQTWRLDLKFLPGREEGMMFVDEKAIHHDDQGPFLWKVANVQVGGPLPADRLLKVDKLRMRLGPAKIPFLGNWIFQQVLIDAPDFDLHRDVVTSRLQTPEGSADDWDGDTVLLVNEQSWKLRPGDVVRVDLSGEEARPGYFAPMETIVRQDGRSYLFVVKDAAAETTVERREILVDEQQAGLASSSMRRILPVGESTLEGVRFVTRGAHYLRDGEAVKVVAKREPSP